jgi:DNA repair photolyase
MSEPNRPIAKGRGSQINPPNRFEAVHHDDDFEQLAEDDEYLQSLRSVPTEYIADNSKSIVSQNDSPDIPFRYSVNAYRGCAHGCVYCYARPTHEYLGLNAGLDFETKIFVKERAPELFRDWLGRDNYEPEVVVFSGVTDCYQPAERHYRLTRRCLEVALEARQPIGIITKNALVTRDLDILQEMAKLEIVSVSLSVTTLDAKLARTMEPRTSTPSARLRTIKELRQAGVPAAVMVSPVIPGLNDSEVPAILQAAAEAGACSASYILLRLPLTVRPVFLDWLERTQPLKKDRIESRIRSTRDGNLTDSKFGKRMRGTGEIAGQINQTFKLFAKRYGLDQRLPPLDVTKFHPPPTRSGQMRLF